MVLLDLSRACLELAREKAHEAGVELAGYEHGDARDLTWFRDGSFDAVLLLGPLYHLLAEEERRRAIREAWRVAQAGGLSFRRLHHALRRGPLGSQGEPGVDPKEPGTP